MANPTETVDITDFSPGIMSDYHGHLPAPAANTSNGYMRMPNGAAVIDETFRCCSDPSGALGPLPALTVGRTQLIPPVPQFPGWPTGHLAWYITDALIIGPFSTGPLGWVDTNSDKDLSAEQNYDIAVQYCFWYNVDGTGVASGYNHYALGRIYKTVTGAPGIGIDYFFDNTTAHWQQSTFPRDIPAAGLTMIRATNGSFASILPDNVFVNMAGIQSGKFQRGTPTTIAAADQFLTTADTDYGTGRYTTSQDAASTSTFNGGAQFHFTDPSTPANVSFWCNPGTYRPLKPSLIIAHQDRVLVVSRDSTLFGPATAVIRDTFSYGAVDDPKALVATSKPWRIEFGSENVSGVGVVASISTDQLFIVKNTGGGYLVTGDLNNPTVQKLPFIESTYNIVSYPTATPLGLVYGTRNGVFLWAGGQSTEKLSSQIEGFLWDVRVPAGSKYEGNQGRFAWWHPWVAVPNNYLWDSRTKAWWRLDQVMNVPPVGITDTTGIYDAPLMHYVVNPANGNLHAFPKMLTHTQTTVDFVLNPTVLASSYSWKSQVLAETRDRMRSFQQIMLHASGKGDQAIAVTLSGYDETGALVTSNTETFTFTGAANGRPVVLRHNLHTNFVAMDVQVRIVVTQAQGTSAAAKIHAIRIGTRDAARSRIDQ